MGARRCGIVMGGASPTFKYDYVAHVSARTRPSPSLLLGYVVQGEGLGSRLVFMYEFMQSLSPTLFVLLC